MQRLRYSLLLLLLLPAASAQVLATSPFSTAIARARALEAGALATDVPHHIHYDLKLYDHRGNRTKGTWDLWSDPLHFTRTDIVAGKFHYTHIEDLAHTIQWRHFNTLMPLKVYDLRRNFIEPVYAVTWFSLPAGDRTVQFEQVEGSPFDCTKVLFQMRVCFDPFVHVLAFAQVFNQTMTWEDWQPVGTHMIPGRFRIYDGGGLIVEATGKAEVVKSFPPGLFTIPAHEPDMGEPENRGMTPHAIVGSKPVPLDMIYGNLLVKLEVAADGQVHKAHLVDSDDDDLISPGMEFAKHLSFAAQPAPFEQYLYLRYMPGVQ
jgi:hypothetical protein